MLFHLGGSLSRSSIDPSPRWGRPLHIFCYYTCRRSAHSIHFGSTSSASLSGYLIQWKVRTLLTLDSLYSQHFSVQSDNVLRFIPYAKSSSYPWWRVVRILSWVLISLLHQVLQCNGFLRLLLLLPCVVVVVVVVIAMIMVMLVLGLLVNVHLLLLSLVFSCWLAVVCYWQLVLGCWLFFTFAVVGMLLVVSSCCQLAFGRRVLVALVSNQSAGCSRF